MSEDKDKKEEKKKEGHVEWGERDRRLQDTIEKGETMNEEEFQNLLQKRIITRVSKRRK